MKFTPVITPVVLAAGLIFSGLAVAPSAEAAPKKATTHCSTAKDPRGYIWAGSCEWWPGYDTDTSGTHQSYDPRLAEAWDSFDALQDPPLFDDTHVLAYVTTVHKAPHKKRGYVIVKSVDTRKTWIIFKYITPRRHH